MSVIAFGTGWRDRRGRVRTLLWIGDAGWVVWDDGHGVDVIRRAVHDETGLRLRLHGWEHHVDDPTGHEWVIDRVLYWEQGGRDDLCLLCQGEGWATVDQAGELVSQPCPCGKVPF